MLLLCYFIFY